MKKLPPHPDAQSSGSQIGVNIYKNKIKIYEKFKRFKKNISHYYIRIVYLIYFIYNFW